MTLSHLLKVVRALLEGVQADTLQVEPVDGVVLTCEHLLAMELVLRHCLISLVLLGQLWWIGDRLR